MNIGELVLSRYEVDDLLPSGGQAHVARAIDCKTGDQVVIKQLDRLPGDKGYSQELARFERAAATRIGHPVVVDPVDAGQDNGEHCIVFPFVEGSQLDRYIEHHGGTLSPDRVLAIITQLAEGLGAIHAKGLVHRDLKPANILIAANGDPRIIDLGIARHVHEATLTETDTVLGTPWWMSPEQIQDPRSVDGRSDLYALGAVLYFMLTGKPPADGDSPVAVALSICQKLPTPPRQLNPAVDEHVDRICMKLLQKAPGARYSDCAELLAAIAASGADDPHASASFCTSCGNGLNVGFAFCPSCGAPRAAPDQAQRCLACGTPIDAATATSGPATCPGCQRPFTSSDHRLTFQRGPLTGLCYRIPEGIYVVGRHQLDPRDSHISRQHFHVASLNGSVQIQDAGSANRTLINQEPAARPLALSSGSTLTIASNSALYSHH